MKMEKTLSSNKIERLIFMGTSDFAVPVFYKLVNSDYKPVLLVTQPERRSGRRKNKKPELIKLAEEYSVPIYQPDDINSDEAIIYLASLNADVMITASYGAILKKRVRLLTHFGCYNIHPSLLPLYRGATPVNFPLFNGDSVTGVTIFLMKAKMDTGPILIQEEYKISDDGCYTVLQNNLSEFSGKLLIKALKMLEEGSFKLVTQDHEIATYTRKIAKDDLPINWNDDAQNIVNKIKGLAILPGAKSKIKGKDIKIVSARIGQSSNNSNPGEIVDIIKKVGFEVVAGNKQTVIITQVQPAGKKVMNCFDYNLGARLSVGDSFEE